jgi:hypothetical protein
MSGTAPNSTTAGVGTGPAGAPAAPGAAEPKADDPVPAAAAKHWEGHPEGPFAGIVAWATGEFARLEAMITKDAPKVEATIAAVESDISDKLAPTGSSTMGTSVTQPSMPATPNMGGTKE